MYIFFTAVYLHLLGPCSPIHHPCIVSNSHIQIRQTIEKQFISVTIIIIRTYTFVYKWICLNRFSASKENLCFIITTKTKTMDIHLHKVNGKCDTCLNERRLDIKRKFNTIIESLFNNSIKLSDLPLIESLEQKTVSRHHIMYIVRETRHLP